MKKEKKKMSRQGKIAIMVIGIIILAIMIIGVVYKVNQKKEDVAVEGQADVVQSEEIKPNGEFVKVENGLRTNTSERFSKPREIEGLEINNIRLTENGDVTILLADVKNKTEEVGGDFGVDIKILDKEGNEIMSLAGYIDKVNPGETVQLNASATSDFANAYDFDITKQ